MIILLLSIRSCLPKLSYYSVGAVILLLLSSTLLTSAGYGQVFPNTQHSTVPSNSSIVQQPQPTQKTLHLVKITSPAKGQQVAAGKDLIISGTSADNTTSSCKVSVIVNGIKPYRTAFPNGAGGGGDYSKWNFTLTPAYTSIKQGQDKITAKFSCTNDPNLISHNSVNVTGVDTSLTPITNQHAQYTGKNSTTTSVNTTSTGNATAITSSSPPSVANTNNTSNDGIMSVSIHLAKKSIHPGDTQSVIIKVTDVNSTIPVVGASVLGRVTDPSGGSFKKIGGTTDDTGKSSYSWTLSQGDTTGQYKTIIEVSAYGYKNSTASKTFRVSPIPVTTTTSSNNSLIPLPSPNAINNNNKNNHQNLPSTIIPIPHIRIPTIRVPFHLPFQ
jgi:Big-like domain-containing protein